MKAKNTKPAGQRLDTLTQNIRESIAQLEAQDARLTKAGCLKAYAHFKTGTRKMYLNEPCDPRNGRRRFTYVGVDPDAQAEALAKIARHEVREQLRENIAQLNHQLADIDEQLDDLLDDLSGLARDAGDATIELKKGHKTARRRAPRRHPGTRLGSPNARAGAGQA